VTLHAFAFFEWHRDTYDRRGRRRLSDILDLPWSDVYLLEPRRDGMISFCRIAALPCAALAVLLFPWKVRAVCADELADEALAAYQRGDFVAAAEFFDQAVAGGLDDTSTLYNAACSHALSGHTDEAFAILDTAIAKRFIDCESLARDSDFASLRSDPRWDALTAACMKAKEEHDRFWNGSIWKSPYQDDLSDTEKVAGLSRVWSEARFNFVNFSLVPSLDWDAAYHEHIPKVLATKSTREYYRVLEEFVALLRDGHSGVNLPQELLDAVRSRPPITTRLVEGRVLVRDVLDPELRADGVVPGLEIAEIDGVPVRAHAESNVMPHLSASTTQDLESRAFEVNLLDGAAGTSVTVGFLDANGKSSTIALPRLAPAERRTLEPPSPLVDLKMLDDGVAHVTIRSFNDERVVADFEAILPQLVSARGLVIDLRENGGGNSGNADRILSMLTAGEFPSQRWWTREYRPAMRAWGNPEGTYGRTAKVGGSGDKAWPGPAVVLTSARTYSAAEDFVVAFLGAERGRVIGEPTGGSTGQPLALSIPGGGAVRICTKRNTLVDGREFVGIGIQPDLLVRPTIADFRANRDAVLVAAVKELTGSRR
jgi:C-terminal processing protease CtpA/Prc